MTWSKLFHTKFYVIDVRLRGFEAMQKQCFVQVSLHVGNNASNVNCEMKYVNSKEIGKSYHRAN